MTFSSSSMICRKSRRMKPEMFPETGTLPRWGADWNSSHSTCTGVRGQRLNTRGQVGVMEVRSQHLSYEGKRGGDYIAFWLRGRSLLELQTTRDMM